MIAYLLGRSLSGFSPQFDSLVFHGIFDELYDFAGYLLHFETVWGMMRGVGGVRKSMHHSWLAKALGLGLLCWGFKGVQQEIPSEEANILQIGSVAFSPGQYTSPQLHPCHRLFDQEGHQDTSSPSLSSRPCSLWLLVIP